MFACLTIPQWVEMLTKAELPVLAHSVQELEALRSAGERTSPRNVTEAVLHDPFMTAKVLCYLQQHRGRRRTIDITTIAHALMMLGLQPFYDHFGVQDTIEDRLASHPLALEGMMAVMIRARHAALFARDWAVQRKDIDPEEVMVAALLHDLAEMLLWGFSPARANAIVDLQRRDRFLRSDAAQRNVLGFPLIDLQLAMVKTWQLPDLLHELMDAHHKHNPRVKNVEYAVAVARHVSHGWSDAALPHDYNAVAGWLGTSPEEVERRVRDVAAQATADMAWYGMTTESALPRLSEG